MKLSRVVLVFGLALLLFGERHDTARADGYPLNGTMSGQNYWWFRNISYSSQGRTNGAASFVGDCGASADCGLVSFPFTAGNGANLKFYASAAVGQQQRIGVQVFDHTAGTFAQIYYQLFTCPQGQWCEHNVAIGGYSGHVIQVRFFNDYNTNGKIADVSCDTCTAASAALPPYINGLFNTGLPRWAPAWLDSSHVAWTNATGHNQLGAARILGFGGWNWLLSYPLVLDSNTWQACFAGDSGQTAVKILIAMVDYQSPTYQYQGDILFSDITVNYDLHSGWTCFGWDPSMWAGDSVQWRIGISSNVNSYLYIDDVCPMPGGCLTGTSPGPTSTPGATGTPFPTFPPYPTPLATWTPNVYPTPPPQFTQIPYPTPPPQFTQIPYPTEPPYPTFPPFPTYPWEAGTPVPVTFAGTPQPVYLTTPIVFPTPLATWTQYPTRLATWTAVPTATNTPTITPASQPTVGFVVLGSNNVGRNFLDGKVPVNVNPLGPDRSNDIATGHYDVMQIAFCIPGDITRIATWLAGCYDIPIWSVTQLKILGVDLVPFFTTICAVFTLVTIIIRIRNK